MSNIDNINISPNNFNKLGDYYLQRGLLYFKNNQYSKSFEFLKQCIDYKTCFDNITKSIQSKDIEEIHHNIYFCEEIEGNDLLFIHSFILTFILKDYDSALTNLDKYLKISNDFYGNLIKTIILCEKSYEYNADVIFNDLKNYYENPIVTYYLAVHKKKFGIDYAELIHTNYINNYTSTCSLFLLTEIYDKKNESILITSENDNNNVLVVFFKNKQRTTNAFVDFYKDYINLQITSEDTLNIAIINNIFEFIEVISKNKQLFIEIEETTESFYNLKLNEEAERFDEFYEGYVISSFDHYNNSSNDDYFDESKDLDQQDPEFWDNC